MMKRIPTAAINHRIINTNNTCSNDNSWRIINKDDCINDNNIYYYYY